MFVLPLYIKKLPGLEILNSMLKHYEEREDYEKCGQLLSMQQQVTNTTTC